MNTEHLVEVVQSGQLDIDSTRSLIKLIQNYSKIEDAVLNWSISHYHTYDYMRLIQDILDVG